MDEIKVIPEAGKPVASIYGKLSLLIIDDHRTMIEVVRGLLLLIGFTQIDTAMDGQKGLQALEQKSYDLVISDWNMPIMDGLELLKRVRSSTNPKIKAIPFILLTAESKTDNIIAAKQAGVNNYIIKPLTKDLLKQKIDITLGIL